MAVRTGLRSVSAAAMLGVATLTAGAMPVVLAPAAVAAPITQWNIDPDAKGSIEIHKYSNVNEGTASTGETMDDSNFGDKLPGAVFKVSQVDADLTTIEGFTAASKLTPQTASLKQDGKGVVTEPTNDQGVTTASDLPVGLYLVEETQAPANHDPIKPFLVFIPMTKGVEAGADQPSQASEWLYDVKVYPKDNPNQGQVLKNITDGHEGQKDYFNAGDKLNFDIFTKVPQLSDGTNLKSLTVYDDLQENMVTVNKEEVEVRIVSGTVPQNELADGTEASNPNADAPLANVNELQKLEAGTDYETRMGAGDVLTVWLTKAGLDKVNNLKNTADLAVQVTIPATIKEVTDENGGVLKNRASVLTNTGSGETTEQQTPPEVPPGETPPGEKTNEVEARWGRLVINKTNPEGAAVEGAAFQVYRCDSADNLLGEALFGGQEFTTDSTGIAKINGLHTTDLVQDQHNAAGQYKYCVVETKTQNGLQLLPKPIEITFTGADLDPVGSSLDNNWTKAQDIENQAIPKLPLTGGKGIALIVVLGAALVGAGVAYARRTSKKA